MYLGIGSYTYAWAIGVLGYPQPPKPMTPFGLLHKAVSLKVELVQICDNLPLHTLSRKEIEQLRNTAKELKIAIEIGARGIDPGYLLQYLEIANFFNSRVVRTLIVPEGNSPQPLQSKWVESCLRQVLPTYEKAGVCLAIENYEAYHTQFLVKLMKKFSSPSLGVCLDTVNSFGALENPKQVAKVLLPYTRSLHIKDFTIQRVNHKLGFQVTGTPAGKGKLDILYLLEELKKYEPNASVVLELWTPYSGDIEITIAREEEWARESIDYLRRMNTNNAVNLL